MAFGSPDSFAINPKVYGRNFISTYQFLWHPDKSCIRDKVTRAAGRRAAGSVFCSPFRKFILKSKFVPSTGTHTRAAFTLTRGIAPICRDWQKTRQPWRRRPLIKPPTVRFHAHFGRRLSHLSNLSWHLHFRRLPGLRRLSIVAKP